MNRDAHVGCLSGGTGARWRAAPARAGRAWTSPSPAWLPLLASALLLLAVPEARGDVRKPDGTPLPPTEELEVQQQITDPHIRVVYAGLKARELPAPPGPDNPETGDPIEYAAEYFSAMDFEPPNGGGKYYLLVVARRIGEKYAARRVVGWVHSKYLLTTTHPLEDPATGLSQKAMVVNSLDDIAEDLKLLQGRTGRGSDRFAGPRPGRTASPPARTSGSSTCSSCTPCADDHVLIGRSLNFDPSKEDPKNVLVGWLPEERICIGSPASRSTGARPHPARPRASSSRRPRTRSPPSRETPPRP